MTTWPNWTRSDADDAALRRRRRGSSRTGGAGRRGPAARVVADRRRGSSRTGGAGLRAPAAKTSGSAGFDDALQRFQVGQDGRGVARELLVGHGGLATQREGELTAV